ncbi:MAG: hypothetical protein V3S07_05825 [Micropepsaceae bacterium]
MQEWIWIAAIAAACAAAAVFIFIAYSKRNSTAATIVRSNDREENYANRAASASLESKRRMEQMQREHYSAMQSMQKRSRRAQELVESSGVSDSACELFLIARRWHRDWLRREREGTIAPERLVLPENLEQLVIDQDGAWLNWVDDGAHFRLELDKRLNRFTLFVEDHNVLCFDASGDAKLGHLKARDVVSFRAGDWMMRLNDAVGEIRIADLKALHADEFDVFGQKMENINF